MILMGLFLHIQITPVHKINVICSKTWLLGGLTFYLFLKQKLMKPTFPHNTLVHYPHIKLAQNKWGWYSPLCKGRTFIKEEMAHRGMYNPSKDLISSHIKSLSMTLLLWVI